MSGPAAAAVAAHAAGALQAQRVVHELRLGDVPAGALLEALRAIVNTDDEERLRGFVNELQKAIARGGPRHGGTP